MYSDKCKYCDKVIEGYSKNQVEYLMFQHVLSKHRSKLQTVD